MDPVGFVAGELRRGRPLARGRGRREPIDASGGLPDGSKFDGRRRARAGAAEAARALRRHADRKASDLRARARRRVLTTRRRSARSCAKRGRSDYRFSSLVLGVVNSTPFQMRRIAMIITKKALPRRTFLRGVGATLALPLLDAMVPAHDRAGGDAGQSGAPPGLRLHADGLRHRAVDAARRPHARPSCRRALSPLAAGRGSPHGASATWS